MQVCTLLQTDNHASTSPLSFLQAGCPSCHPTNNIKALKAYIHTNLYSARNCENEFEARLISQKYILFVQQHWCTSTMVVGGVDGQVVQYRQQSRLDEKRKKAMDMHLSFIVDQTEKYSTWLTEGLAATASAVATATAVAPVKTSSSVTTAGAEKSSLDPDGRF